MQTIPAWGRSLWTRAGQPTPVFLPGEFQEQRAWWAVVHCVPKSPIWPQWQSTHRCRYVITFEEILNQEHRGRKRDLDISKFEISLTNAQAVEKLLVYHSGQSTWRKNKLILLMPITKLFHLWNYKAVNSVKQNRGSQETQRENTEISQTRFQLHREVTRTHRQQVPVGLLHHVPVQGPLSRNQALPLLWSEPDVHMLDSQLCLKWKRISLTGAEEASYFYIKGE